MCTCFNRQLNCVLNGKRTVRAGSYLSGVRVEYVVVRERFIGAEYHLGLAGRHRGARAAHIDHLARRLRTDPGKQSDIQRRGTPSIIKQSASSLCAVLLRAIDGYRTRPYKERFHLS